MKNITFIAILDNDSPTLLYNEIVVKHSKFEGNSSSFSDSGALLEYGVNAEMDHSHLLILDLNCEGVSAFSILDSLRATYVNVDYRVVLLAAIITEEDILTAKTYGEVVKIMEKPLSIPTLNQLLSLNLEPA